MLGIPLLRLQGLKKRIRNTMSDINVNAKNSYELATALFPQEAWIPVEANIWAAESRLVEEEREPKKWEREMSQVRILTSRGSAAFFLPERHIQGESGKTCADLVMDGEVTEIKTISGTRATLGKQFKHGYKQGKSLLAANLPDGYRPQGHSVYIYLKSDLKVEAVKAKIAGELKNRLDQGSFICFFEQSGKLYSWSYLELRSMIGKR
jgi:hypothetical protein